MLDLKGRTYGGLEVIELAQPRFAPSGHKTIYWKCRCKECGRIVERSAAVIVHANIHDCGCCKTPKLKVGEKYDKILILSIAENTRPKKYLCKCEICGGTFISVGQELRRNQHDGCPKCRKNVRDAKKVEELNKLYKGKVFGELTVENVHLVYNEKIKCDKPYATCKCSCGNEKDILLSRILQGGALSCGHNTKRNLDMGWEVGKDGYVEGTNIFCIRPNKKTNKNSSTGITGVSALGDGYRAYINFKRKQYSLGTYRDIEDAKKARKEAEKRIYGNFLDWYAETYPERWEKLKDKVRGEEHGE